MTSVPQTELDALDALPTSIFQAQFNLTPAQISDIRRRMRRVRVALCSARNAHAAINALSPDLLGLIFALVQPSCDGFAPAWPSSGSLEWISVTHVCAHWRTIALSLPTLWSTIKLCQDIASEAGNAFLARSGTAPLTVFFSGAPFGRGDETVLQVILDHHISRVRGLHVAVTDYSQLDHIYHRFGHELPNLRRLSLVVPKRRQPFSFPATCVQCRFPSIRMLRVQDNSMWRRNIFAYLTHLALYEDVDESDLLAFLDFLAGSPLLEVLFMAQCSFSPTPRSHPLTLSRLRRLQLKGDRAGEWPLIHSLEIPSACDVRLQFLGWPRSEAKLITLMPPSARFFPLQHDIHDLHISMYDEPESYRFVLCAGFVFINGVQDLDSLIDLVDPDTSLTIDMQEVQANHLRAVASWSHFLSNFPRIRTLRILRCPSRLLPIVLDALAMESEVNATTMLCPALTKLHIYRRQDRELVNTTELCVWKVVNLRAHAGVALEEVHLYDGSEVTILSLNSMGTPLEIVSQRAHTSISMLRHDVLERVGLLDDDDEDPEGWQIDRRSSPQRSSPWSARSYPGRRISPYESPEVLSFEGASTDDELSLEEEMTAEVRVATSE